MEYRYPKVKWVSLNNQALLARSTLINLDPVELRLYCFTVSLVALTGSYNTLDDLFNRLCNLNKKIQIWKACKMIVGIKWIKIISKANFVGL